MKRIKISIQNPVEKQGIGYQLLVTTKKSENFKPKAENFSKVRSQNPGVRMKTAFLLTPGSWLLNSFFKRFTFCFCTLVLLLFFLVPTEGLGADAKADAKDERHVYAIQNKVFHYFHEFGVSLGYIPDDNFYHLYPISLHYTFHLNEHIAWEVVRGSLALDQEKDLRKNLEKKFGVAPTEFEQPKYMIHSHLVLKPFYGKDAVWNRRILNHEGYFFLGGGMISYETQPTGGTKNVLSASLGVGTKYFIHKHLCMNVEIWDFVNFKDEGAENSICLGLGFGFQFNLSPRKTERDETIKNLQRYLRPERG